MDSNNNDNIEIGNVENYSSEKVEYSHSTHVDICIKKCIFAGCRELCEGYNETIVDGKENTKIIYKEDTRKAFIEAVKTCKMIMVCDFDDTATENISNLIKKIKQTQKNLLEKQMNYWNGLDYNSKKSFLSQGKPAPSISCFHSDLGYWNLFVESELNIYREIFEELNLLSSRLGHYKSEDFEA